MIEAALAGLGAALLPAYLIEREVGQGRLVSIGGAPPPADTDTAYYVVIPEGRVREPIVQAFLGWITTQVPAA